MNPRLRFVTVGYVAVTDRTDHRAQTGTRRSTWQRPIGAVRRRARVGGKLDRSQSCAAPAPGKSFWLPQVAERVLRTPVSTSVGQARQVLVVDDDPDVLELVAGYLSAHGYEVASAADAGCARRVLENQRIDLVVLDLNLPDEDGLDLTRYLTEKHGCAVIIVSARTDAIDRVVGLELGADDYMTKPFEPRELLARVRSLLRRMTQAGHGDERAGDRIEFEGFRLDPLARRLLDAGGQEISLTGGEYDLLCALIEKPQRVMSRDELMTRTHGRRAGPFDRVIDVQIGRLRRKLEPDSNPPQLIKSVRGGGYMLNAQVRRLEP
jgi:two-component system, OmpR family, response regulator